MSYFGRFFLRRLNALTFRSSSFLGTVTSLLRTASNVATGSRGAVAGSLIGFADSFLNWAPAASPHAGLRHLIVGHHLRRRVACNGHFPVGVLTLAVVPIPVEIDLSVTRIRGVLVPGRGASRPASATDHQDEQSGNGNTLRHYALPSLDRMTAASKKINTLLPTPAHEPKDDHLNY